MAQSIIFFLREDLLEMESVKLLRIFTAFSRDQEQKM